MKIRHGFISNSSSSSFMISDKYISVHQYYQIQHHLEEGKKFRIGDGEDSGNAWNVYLLNGYVYMDTIMDNFDMFEFLKAIGIPEEYILKG